jgi:hypothetical protein
MPPAGFEDLVVLLPGITGSVLRREGKDVWAASPKAVLGGLLSRGGSIRHLKLEDDPPDVDDLQDGVTVGGVIQDAHVIPGLWSIDGYTSVRTSVCGELGLTPGESFFEFAYDWRRDNRVAARRLQRESHEWLQAARARGAKDPKLILVAHSMGGLVSRYFLECLGGWRVTRRLVSFGTPYRGSLNAVNFLANGFHKGWGPLSIDLSDVLRSFTAVHQLLPIYPCVDHGDGQLRRVAEATVPNVDAGKAAAALAFHHEIRDAVTANLKDDAYRDARYGIHPVVGTVQPTWQSARVDDGRVTLARAYEGEDHKGDGTVPRVSSVPVEIEREQGAMYSGERHAALQNAEPVLRQLLGVLTVPDRQPDRFKAFAGTPLGLELEDAYLDTEPVHVRVTPEEDLAERLHVVVADAETGAEARRAPLLKRPDGPFEAELAPLPSGVYRVHVAGGEQAEPVHDVFAVLPEQPPE